ncbi:hypothetical protein ACFW04_011735 [Cataglyphis niger]
MDLIDRIIKSCEYVTVNGDLIAIKACVLQDIATDLKEEAEGVLKESPDSFRVEFRIEGGDDIARTIMKIEDCVKGAREALFELVEKTRKITGQATRVRAALRDCRDEDEGPAPKRSRDERTGSSSKRSRDEGPGPSSGDENDAI